MGRTRTLCVGAPPFFPPQSSIFRIMRKTHLIPVLLLTATSTACDFFEDRSLRIFLKDEGDPGASVQLMMSTEFMPVSMRLE
ncbi:MAG: hypothetical protein CM1200mP14_25910 [Gammaproteobacteria bacterium]|nr:MAG: hypothetical protein CM1200mP14_25910 [Gammaproteobacteria bacterium]